MGVYIELPKEWAKWSFDVRDIHDNILVAKVTDLDLVRCGECKWCDYKGKERALICTNPYIDMDIHPLNFCNYGERKSE